ncbi:thermonuclease family protein [Bradyrhizobium sp. CCGUVB23]|uniref:thermonuclease family protein n=1 Tax=Bradyrhizobium sp. CCGUVB23 TaxID=2949630 RepID=UPI0020B36CAB|nr:thermonuclease family protein [Bradyrhizobium sp. CCGUVB23]MCP3468569.1 thermonuclease family protein [Bradyrhizobium sp. CCGUVB23]
MSKALALATAFLAVSSPVCADQASPWFPVPASAVYLTGDSWIDNGVTYRLYGVQSCIRGTSFTNARGVKRDCGEASLAMLIALTRDLRPQCYEAAKTPQARTVFVFCMAQRPNGTGMSARVDLGTALIAMGYAFAALTPNCRPVHPPYLVAQQVAEKSRAGLWAFSDLPEPNAIIFGALRAGGSAAAATGECPR